MLIKNEYYTNLINCCYLLFTEYISKRDLSQYFDISVSNDIINDIVLIDNTVDSSGLNSCAGITILPKYETDKIHILISDKEIQPNIVLHELSHMYDFILFAEKLCNGILHQIKLNKYYQTFIYWSEFHVKLIEIPCTQIYLELIKNTSEENLLNDFKNKIKNYFYPKYLEKFLNKQNPDIRDIMWYFGELVVCNQYDKNNTYNIDDSLIIKHGIIFYQLYLLLQDCLTIDDFLNQIEEFHFLFFR